MNCPNYEPPEKPTKVVTVRMPPRLHSALTVLGLIKDQSLNQMAVQALEALVEESPNAQVVRKGEYTLHEAREKILAARKREAPRFPQLRD